MCICGVYAVMEESGFKVRVVVGMKILKPTREQIATGVTAETPTTSDLKDSTANIEVKTTIIPHESQFYPTYFSRLLALHLIKDKSEIT